MPPHPHPHPHPASSFVVSLDCNWGICWICVIVDCRLEWDGCYLCACVVCKKVGEREEEDGAMRDCISFYRVCALGLNAFHRDFDLYGRAERQWGERSTRCACLKGEFRFHGPRGQEARARQLLWMLAQAQKIENTKKP